MPCPNSLSPMGLGKQTRKSSPARKAPANRPQTTEKTGLKTVCEMTELSFLAC